MLRTKTFEIKHHLTVIELCRSSAEALVTSSSTQGKEMARRKELAALTGLRVYFADSHAPGSAGPTRTPTACCAFDHLFILPDPLDLQWHTRPCPLPWGGLEATRALRRMGAQRT